MDKSPAQRFVDYLGMGVAISPSEATVGWSGRIGGPQEVFEFGSSGCRGSIFLEAFDRIANQQEQLPPKTTKALADFVSATLNMIGTLATISALTVDTPKRRSPRT